MTDFDPFRIRPGQIRSQQIQRTRPFVHQAMAAAKKAGATVTRGHISAGKRPFGRGRSATLSANRLLSNRSRAAVIKARVVRQRGHPGALKAHLRYLQREGVTKDGDRAHLFGPASDREEAGDFAERTAEDRHHFRFIVSPDDASQMEDLKAFTRDLMRQAEQDLGTRLDWVAVDHWNTEHPHIHVILRGKTDQGDDLIIARDYIKQGLRARAQHLITNELGERTDFEIRHALHRQVEAERFTQLDRQLLTDQRRIGFVDLAPPLDHAPDEFQVLKAGRVRKLESLGLANQFAPGQWVISEKAPTILRELGERGDIIKRIHNGLTEAGLDRTPTSYVLASEALGAPVVGRLVDRGLDDELRGSAFAVIDGIDGRAHHVRLPRLEATGDGEPGAIVEVHTFENERGVRHTAIRVISDLTSEQQIAAEGATWLDKLAVTNRHSAIADTGFGADVLDAIARRGSHLSQQGLASETEAGFNYTKGLLDTLRQRELAATAKQIADQTGLTWAAPKAGDFASGTYRHRLTLASGRFAVLTDAMGFQLVPWTPPLQDRIGQHVSGTMRANGTVNWSFDRQRGLSL